MILFKESNVPKISAVIIRIMIVCYKLLRVRNVLDDSNIYVGHKYLKEVTPKY